jgi:hypothetical protein
VSIRSTEDVSPPRRSRGRDESVRRVSRVIRAVGVLAVLGTALAGGLAATGQGPAPSTARPTAGHARTPRSARVAVHHEARLAVPRDDEAPPARFTPAPVVASPAPPAAPPAPAVQAPVASSGGS